MTAELNNIKNNNVGSPLNVNENQAKEFTEYKAHEIQEIKVSEARVSINETRFTRLKKSLRKRSVSIL